VDGTRRRLIGLGHDLQLVSELAAARALLEPDVFFTSQELRRFASAVVPMASLAGGFAAKEALFKALPAEETWFWTDAELIHDRRGAPRFRVHGSLASHLARRRLQVSVSISHSGGFASSVVVVTGGTSAAARFRDTIGRAVRRVHDRVTARASGAPQ
jgi:holo-[acyl-carrier protein] synthase